MAARGGGGLIAWLKGHCHGGRTWKNSGWLFQVRILSSCWYHNDRTCFQLHYTGIVIFIKTGPVFVDFSCCKMCFCPLEFLKRCSWQCPLYQYLKAMTLADCEGKIVVTPTLYVYIKARLSILLQSVCIKTLSLCVSQLLCNCDLSFLQSSSIHTLKLIY